MLSQCALILLWIADYFVRQVQNSLAMPVFEIYE